MIKNEKAKNQHLNRDDKNNYISIIIVSYIKIIDFLVQL